MLVSAEQKDNKYVSFSGLHTTTSPYEKVCSANAAFSLAQKFLTTGGQFPLQPVVPKDVSLICKYTRIGEEETTATKPLQQSYCNEAIATKPLQRDLVFFSFSTLPYSFLVSIQTTQFL